MTLARLDINLTEQQIQQALIADASAGLSMTRKVLPPKYFYDQRGSELFERITELPEYYPTRVERAILSRAATEIVNIAPPFTSLVELGSGSSSKTPLLLDAMQHLQADISYVPVDVSVHALAGAVGTLRERYPALPVHGVVTDFEKPLTTLPRLGPRMVAFLGGTMGNLDPMQRNQFLANVAEALHPGESFLLGIDLVKDPRRLVSAYDDAAGVTGQFNLNMLSVLNHLLHADFDERRFTHVAVWSEEHSRIEMRLRATQPMHVTLKRLDRRVCFDADEEMRTEISTKFELASIETELAAAGMEVRHWWTGRDDLLRSNEVDYALVLAVRS